MFSLTVPIVSDLTWHSAPIFPNYVNIWQSCHQRTDPNTQPRLTRYYARDPCCAPAIVDYLHFTFVSALLPQFRIIIKCKIILRVKTILYDHGGRTGERRATWDNIRYLIVHGHAAKHRIIMADNGGNMLITSSITFLEFYNLSWYLQFRRVRQIIEWKPKNLEDYFVSICKMAIKVKHSFHNQQSTKLSITLTLSVLSPINSRCIKAFLEAMEIGSIYCG